MGTRFEIVLGGEDSARLAPIADHVLAEITHWHDRLSLFKSDSFLTYINQRAHIAPIPVEPDLFELLTLCARVHAESGGAFDPTVAPLMRAHGFHTGTAHAPFPAPAHTPAPIPVISGAPGMTEVELNNDARTIRFRSPGIALDLGAVAKGFALDMAASHLRAFGVQHALVHGGTSSIVALGDAPGADSSEGGWRIALGPGEDALILTLRDGALSFSAPHGRTVESPDGSARLTHIIDPRTGLPATAEIFSAAVASAMTGNAVDPWPAARCEAWSTALVVLGRRPESMPDSLTSVLASATPGSKREWAVEGPHRPFICEPTPPKPRVPSGPRC